MPDANGQLGEFIFEVGKSRQETWIELITCRIEDPTSIRSVLFQGMTCLPPTFTGYFLGLNSSCSVGGYPEYVVKATTVAQIQLAVNFARERNLRLVIKNTGHDFGAKSVGKGSLSIWTHFLKDKKFIEKYETKDYVGPAAKLGAGVQAAEANAFSKEHGVTLIGGEGKVSAAAFLLKKKLYN
jgi:hypothetical protein